MTKRTPAARALARLDLPADDSGAPRSPKEFPDGGQVRVEIPSVEGPEAMAAVIERASELGVPVHRVSQGSGTVLLLDSEIRELVALGTDSAVEVCLFVGPRAGWDVGAQVTSPSGRGGALVLRGASQLRAAVDDVVRVCDLGVRSLLVADLGCLSVLAAMRTAGELPRDLTLKVSVGLPAANPASARVLAELGASTINLPGDLAVVQLAAIREAIDVPIDLYVESPDDLGGFVRHHEIGALADACAPVYLKFGLRNAPGIYPSGEQLASVVLATARERVRRAAIGLEHLARQAPSTRISPSPVASR